MLDAIKGRRERDDEGFTLIELMVVLLIIAILMAIAIPTFLGARNTANARSTQSNLRNALTAEQTNWTNSQTFTQNLSTTEPSLSWGSAEPTASSASNFVFAQPYSYGGSTTAKAGSSGNEVVIQGYAKDGNCYSLAQVNTPTPPSGVSDGTYYMQTSGACVAEAPPSSAVTQTSAATTPGTWSLSF